MWRFWRLWYAIMCGTWGHRWIPQPSRGCTTGCAHCERCGRELHEGNDRPPKSIWATS